MKAMVLAAGLGTRLKPFTLMRPKPLFPVLGEPLLFRIVGQLRAAGFSPIIVNAYHLAEQLVSALAGQADIVIQREPVELGTGGGLRLALPHFRDDEPVLVTNGDIYHDIDYGAVYARHRQGDAPLTMVMHDYPRFNKVLVAGGLVRGFASSAAPPGPGSAPATLQAFTGIHVLAPRLLTEIPPGRFYSIIDRYHSHLESGGVIRALTVSGHIWQDIGTIGDYLDLHATLLGGAEPKFRLAADVALGRDVILDDWGYVGAGTTIGDGALLRRVVVWDGAVIPKGTILRDSLVTA